MTELRTLLLLELRSLYGINKLLHTRDPKEKRRCWTLCFAMLLLAAVLFTYVGGLVCGLCFLGLSEIVPAYLTVISSALILVFGIFTAGSRIFGQTGYDLLASMPLRSGTLVCSRFLSLYAEDLVLTLAVMLPGLTVYGFCRKPPALFYLSALLGTVLIPAIPLVISTVLGTLVLAVSSRMKGKSLMQSLLMILLVVAVMVGSFSMPGLAAGVTLEDLSQLAQAVSDALGQIYPPALWLGKAMTQGSPADMGLFVLISLAVLGLSLWVVTRNFQSILHRLQSSTARHDYKLGTLAHRGLLRTLFLRELKRYFASSIYVTNTVVGPVLATIMAVALAVMGPEALTETLQLPLDIPGLLPFVFAAVFCTMTTTAVSVSMEGKEFWIVKSLPIPTKIWLDSKLLLNLALMAPCFLVSTAAMAIGVKPDGLQLLWLILIPAAVSLFSVVFGITVNLKFHSFDWEKEETVVKQSLSAMLGGFGGFLVAAAFGLAAALVPVQYADLLKALVCLALLGITLLLYRRNNRAVLSCL